MPVVGPLWSRDDHVTGDAQGTHTFAGFSATPDGLDVTVGCDMSRVDDPKVDFLRDSPSALTVHVQRGGADLYVDAFRVVCYRGKSVTFAAFTRDGTRVDGTAAAPKQVRVGDELDVRYTIAFDNPTGGSEASPRLYGEGFASDGAIDILPTPRVPPGKGRDIYTFRVRAAKPASRPVLRAGPLEGRLNVDIVP